MKEIKKLDSKLDQELDIILKENKAKILENDKKSYTKRLSFLTQKSIQNDEKIGKFSYKIKKSIFGGNDNSNTSTFYKTKYNNDHNGVLVKNETEKNITEFTDSKNELADVFLKSNFNETNNKHIENQIKESDIINDENQKMLLNLNNSNELNNNTENHNINEILSTLNDSDKNFDDVKTYQKSKSKFFMYSKTNPFFITTNSIIKNNEKTSVNEIQNKNNNENDQIIDTPKKIKNNTDLIYKLNMNKKENSQLNSPFKNKFQFIKQYSNKLNNFDHKNSLNIINNKSNSKTLKFQKTNTFFSNNNKKTNEINTSNDLNISKNMLSLKKLNSNENDNFGSNIKINDKIIDSNSNIAADSNFLQSDKILKFNDEIYIRRKNYLNLSDKSINTILKKENNSSNMLPQIIDQNYVEGKYLKYSDMLIDFKAILERRNKRKDCFNKNKSLIKSIYVNDDYFEIMKEDLKSKKKNYSVIKYQEECLSVFKGKASDITLKEMIKGQKYDRQILSRAKNIVIPIDEYIDSLAQFYEKISEKNIKDSFILKEWRKDLANDKTKTKFKNINKDNCIV